VKTVRFKDSAYIGDPRNAVRIFNEKEVDELALLDIAATPEGRGPQLDLVREIVSEAFMPVAYGGGVRSVEDVRALVSVGVEKVVIATAAAADPNFVARAADACGSQSVVVCLDVKRTLFGRYEVYTHSGKRGTGKDPVAFARRMEELGAGELVVNAIDRDGTMAGYDLELLKSVTGAVQIPVIACGGAGRVEDFGAAVREGGASAVAAGSLFVFHGRHRAVLISYPAPGDLRVAFEGVAG
jgi:imidazole glycerol-phosphate synthase subunit HisF